MILIIDPCEECVVAACCEQICNQRWTYTHKCAYQLKYYNEYKNRPISETDEFKKEHEEFLDLWHKICVRNDRLMPNIGSSSSCASSGISISSSSTAVSGFDNNPYAQKAARKAARRLAKKIDTDIMSSYINKAKHAFGFHKRKM
jgi:hypothetical protein